MSKNATAVARAQWPAAADPVIAYAEWRMSCTSVWEAYRNWSSAPKTETSIAHAAYTAALDREEAAARVYSSLLKPVEGPGRAAWMWLRRELPHSP